MENLTSELLNEYIKGLESEAKIEVLETLDIDDIKIAYNYGCVSGVSGFVYYSETEAFFDKHVDEILECLQNCINKYGQMPSDFEFTRNNLTWIFVEETVRELVNDLDLY